MIFSFKGFIPVVDSSSFIHPQATVVGNVQMAARIVLAARNVATERCRAATLDRRHDLHLCKADVTAIGITPCRAMVTEDVRDLQSLTRHAGRDLRLRLGLLALARLDGTA